MPGAAGVDLTAIQHDLGHSSAVTDAVVFRETAKESVRATATLLESHARVRTSLEGACKA